LAFEYEDSDGNRYPPDDPPVDTPIYIYPDPVLPYFCHGRNTRNASAGYKPNTYCKKDITYWKNDKYINIKRPCKSNVITVDFVKRVCNTNVLATNLIERSFTNYKSCRISDRFNDTIGKHFICGSLPRTINLIKVDLVTGKVCRKVEPDAIVNLRPCRKIIKWTIDPVIGKWRGNKCYVAYSPNIYTNKPCLNLPVGHLEDFKIFTHVCKNPGFIENEMVPAKFWCRVSMVGPQAPVINKTVAPRLQTYTCHKTEVYVLVPQGNKVFCGFRNVIANTFTSTATTCRMTSKIYWATDLKVRRFNCGIIKLSTYAGITYGRTFGGRPYVNGFTRVSGRMIGKLSNP